MQVASRYQVGDGKYADLVSESIKAAVQAQVEQKITAGEALERAIADEDRAREAHESSVRETQTARREAMRAGWTETELKRLGLAGASKRTRAAGRRTDAPSGNDHEEQ